jgi:hypothetical protein
MSAPAHLDWLVDTGERLKSADGVEIEVWELQHGDDPAVFSAWAKHFREHYCDEEMLTKLVAGTGETHAQYLLNKKFPDEKDPPGPSIRAGDFAEILVADYIEYKLGCWCPRQLRYDQKWNRNESTKGCDVLGSSSSRGTACSACSRTAGSAGPTSETLVSSAADLGIRVLAPEEGGLRPPKSVVSARVQNHASKKEALHAAPRIQRSRNPPHPATAGAGGEGAVPTEGLGDGERSRPPAFQRGGEGASAVSPLAPTFLS